MAKKRTKNKVSQASEPTDILEHTCTHIRKGLEQGSLKKALPEADWKICQDCQTDNKTKENVDEEVEETPSVWLCLKCGHRGCDRNSQEKHALQHYKTPRSDCHCLVLNLDNWSVWCYLCDDEVPYNSSTRLGQLVDYVRKETNKQTRIQSTKLEQEKKELENKKLEKDSKNEKERVKNINKLEENAVPVIHTNVEVLVKGFSNLGNTCFFNAVMQNLSQTPVLRQLLKEVKMTGTTVTVESLDSPPNLPLEIKLEQQPGPLTSSMCQFLTDIEETKNGTVNPKELFSQVCKKAIRFRGYQQQDSQELLRYLLDGMRGEEIQRVKGGLMDYMKHSSQNTEDKEEIKRKANEFEKKRAIPNFVDRIFGGELSSTIMCDECRTVSLVQESFLDLSLPVLDEQTVKKDTTPKHFTAVSEKKIEDEDDDDNDSYLKEKTESTTTSKHLQKKAKKQAKKHAKIQRRQNRVIPLSEIATVKGDPDENTNCCEEKSQQDPPFENDNSNQEVEGLIQTVEQRLNLKNMVKEESDESIVSERRKSLSELDVSNLTTKENLESVGVSSDDVNGYNIPILDEGSPPCSDKVGSCLDCSTPCLEKVSPGLENGNHPLEMGAFRFEAGESVLIEGRTFLGDENPPCLEIFNPCLEEESRDLREDSTLCLENVSLHCENGRPCMKEHNQCLTENSSCLETGRCFLREDSLHLNNESQSLGERSSCFEKSSPDIQQCPGAEEDSSRLEEESPCLKDSSPSQEDTDISLNVNDLSLEHKSPCVTDCWPSVEKDSHDLERDCEHINELINDLEELHLSEEAEPSTTHSGFINSSPIESKLYEIVNQDPETAFCTLGDRQCINAEECSLESCLYQFTRNEKLSETNRLLCNVCTQTKCNKWNSNIKVEKKHVYTNAKKQMLISLAPPILTLHLKRFQQAGINLRKVNRHIKFPELIDIAPFCTIKCKNVAEGDSKVLYSLYGVVEHSGTMRSGHYTAFVKVRQPNIRLSDLVIHRVISQGLETEPMKGQWYHISDTHVQTVPLTTVLNSQAYLLFYERIL